MNELNFEMIGQKIRKRRQEIGMKQEKMAELLDVNPSHVSNIERGRANPSLTALVNIANILNCSVDQFLESEYHFSEKSTDLDEKIRKSTQNMDDATKSKLLKIADILKQ